MFGRNKIKKDPSAFNFRKHAWKQFKKNRAALVSLYFLFFLVIVAMFASFIANDKPLYAKYRGKTYYPVLNQHWLFKSLFNTANADSTFNPETGNYEVLQYDITDWKSLDLESSVWPLIPFSPSSQDIYNRDFAAPGDEHFMRDESGKIVEAEGRFRHVLGTDMLGRDVLAGVIHGTKISLSVGIISMGIAVLAGLLLGAIAGFYGDYKLKASRIKIFFFFIGLFVGYFYAFIARKFVVSEAFEESGWSGWMQFLFSMIIFIVTPILFTRFAKIFERGWLGEKKYIPADTIVSRFIEVFNSMPRLLLIITISAIIEERSLFLVMVIIGLTSWTEIARFTRAELLRIREMDYIESARSLGISNRQIIFRHALPNALAPVFVSIAFGIAAAILIESGLSFLNIGVPDDTVTWGSMLNIGRIEPEAWWMVIFPGIAIFITVTIYNLIGEGLRDALDPRLKK
jgi:peptide/nickel transport system permease protein